VNVQKNQKYNLKKINLSVLKMLSLILNV